MTHRQEVLGALEATDQMKLIRIVHSRWQGIKQRCLNPRNASWADYGGRGIKIAPEWQEDFMAFLKEVGLPPSPAYTLDRVDNEKGYEPGNMRWALPWEQNNNRRQRTAAKTGYPGVVEELHRGKPRWKVRVMFRGNYFYLYIGTDQEKAVAVRKAWDAKTTEEKYRTVYPGGLGI